MGVSKKKQKTQTRSQAGTCSCIDVLKHLHVLHVQCVYLHSCSLPGAYKPVLLCSLVRGSSYALLRSCFGGVALVVKYNLEDGLEFVAGFAAVVPLDSCCLLSSKIAMYVEQEVVERKQETAHS